MASHVPPTSPQNPVICYSKLDIERKFFVKSGKFTQVNSFATCVMAICLTALLFGSLMPFSPAWADIFLKRGFIPYFVMFFTFWGLMILFIKGKKLKLQRRVLDFDLVPRNADFVLSGDTVPLIHDRLFELVDEPEKFCLYRRIFAAINSIRNLGRISDAGEVMRAQAEADEASSETSYSLIKGFLWAIPVLGFIGTVLGLSRAIGGFGEVLSSAKDIGSITASLQGVTAGLSTAFDTTLLALICALGLQFLTTLMKKKEEEFLDSCTDYCQTQIIDRIKIALVQDH